jgi:hypothetical protein
MISAILARSQGVSAVFRIAVLMKLFLCAPCEQIKNIFAAAGFRRPVAAHNWHRRRLSANRLNMLSVLIETRNDEEALARTLASLVGAAVAGMVRDVIVCDLGSTDQTRYVAEHAGCHFVASGGIAAGIGAAKADWLLLVEPGARLLEGWTDPVLAHVNGSTIPARLSRARGERLPFLARAFSANRPLAQALLITRRQAAALAKNAGSAEALARGLAMRQIAGEISPAKR